MSSKSLLPAISAQGLGKRYTLYARPIDRLWQAIFPRRHYGREFIALDNISFELPRGEVLGIIGKNGAGKSTLLQIICGTLRPTSGSITVNGRIAALLELGAGFNPEFTGRENIYMNAAILGLSREETEARFQSIVDFSELGDFIGQPVKTYSSGMYVRLAFAIATSVDPDILIIDEALSVGDGAFARKSFDRIMALKDGGATILFCSHTMYHIEAICNQVLWLEKGRMVDLGAPEKVARSYGESLIVAKAPPPTAESTAPPATAESAPAKLARFTRIAVSIDGKTGKQLTAQAGRSLLEATVEFEFAPHLPIPSVVAIIETIPGQIITSVGTAFDDHLLTPTAAGKAQVRLRCPKLPIMRGQYRFSLYLTCEKVIHIYEEVLYCAEIDVTDEGVCPGLMFLPHAWDDAPLIASLQRHAP